MKNDQTLKTDALGMVLKHDAVITISNKELAITVAEYVERNYPVEAVAVKFDMVRKVIFSELTNVDANVFVRQKEKELSE